MNRASEHVCEVLDSAEHRSEECLWSFPGEGKNTAAPYPDKVPDKVKVIERSRSCLAWERQSRCRNRNSLQRNGSKPETETDRVVGYRGAGFGPATYLPGSTP